ncbi:MAG TPA: thiamine phosphate synthase [Candidatus Udaeobacter sp.]|nr:thiamine phosphate synthase [Candidatus Udaeobacter sp.]
MPVAMAVVSSAEDGLRAAERATVLQLRAPSLSTRNLELEATCLVRAVHVPVLISSRADVAIATGAAGVNLPERDIAVRDARALMGPGLVGRSVHSMEAAREAERDGADYVIFGPVWPSRTHADAPAAGIDQLARVARALRIPVLAIGGVTEGRVTECLSAGAAGYAAIGLFE